MQQGEVLSLQSLEGANRREKKAVYEHIEVDRKKVGKKPHSISITVIGEIDAGCLGKNSWDCLVRMYMPRMLDMSVIDWVKQRLEALQKLRETMDHNFEYLEEQIECIGLQECY